MGGIPPAPRGVPQIEVSFDIDANGVVNVSASDKSTGKKQSVTVRSSGGLSDKEIERMVQEDEEMRETDTLKKEGVTVKNDAETLCYQVEKQLSELKDKMSTADADDLKKKMEDVRACIVGDDLDVELAKSKTKELQEASWKVTQQAYQQAGSEEAGGDEKTPEDSKWQEEKEEKKDDKKEKK